MANYNYKKENGSRLVNIGIDAFKTLEEEEKERLAASQSTRKNKAAPARPSPVRQPGCIYQYQPQQPQVYQMNPVSSSEKIITSYDAMKLYDGLLITDYPKRTMAY
ncbi:hypothetical protein ACH5RR_033505 [Cinchona calisaya]|uniref:Uncharacterized protein n=1 Tax=Cinchona calisaya TaxID=153742 RepID=A0ABD2YL61_9GENT